MLAPKVPLEARVAAAKDNVRNAFASNEVYCDSVAAKVKSVHDDVSAASGRIEAAFGTIHSLLAQAGIFIPPLESRDCLFQSHRKSLPSLVDVSDCERLICLRTFADILRARHYALGAFECDIIVRTERLLSEMTLANVALMQAFGPLERQVPKIVDPRFVFHAFLVPGLFLSFWALLLSDDLPYVAPQVMEVSAAIGSISVALSVWLNRSKRRLFEVLSKEAEPEPLAVAFANMTRPYLIRFDNLVIDSERLIRECTEGLDGLQAELAAILADSSTESLSESIKHKQ